MKSRVKNALIFSVLIIIGLIVRLVFALNLRGNNFAEADNGGTWLPRS